MTPQTSEDIDLRITKSNITQLRNINEKLRFKIRSLYNRVTFLEERLRYYESRFDKRTYINCKVKKQRGR